jgi:hypothetical protein
VRQEGFWGEATKIPWDGKGSNTQLIWQDKEKKKSMKIDMERGKEHE